MLETVTKIPEGSPVVSKPAMILNKDATVMYNSKIVPLVNIWSEVVGEYEGKPLLKGKAYQFFVQVTRVIVGSKITYGIPRKNAVVISIDRNLDYSKEKSGVCIEYNSKDQKIVKYNSCHLVTSPQFIPIDYKLYYDIWAWYRDKNKSKKLAPQLVGSYYSVEEIGGRKFATNPVFPEEINEKEVLYEKDPVNRLKRVQELFDQNKKNNEEIEEHITVLLNKKETL